MNWIIINLNDPNRLGGPGGGHGGGYPLKRFAIRTPPLSIMYSVCKRKGAVPSLIMLT